MANVIREKPNVVDKIVHMNTSLLKVPSINVLRTRSQIDASLLDGLLMSSNTQFQILVRHSKQNLVIEISRTFILDTLLLCQPSHCSDQTHQSSRFQSPSRACEFVSTTKTNPQVAAGLTGHRWSSTLSHR